MREMEDGHINRFCYYHIKDIALRCENVWIDQKTFGRIPKRKFVLQGKWNEKKYILYVSECGVNLKHVKKQTEKICLAAVKQNGCALRYVQDQTEKVCLAAVKGDGFALMYVRNQTKKVCLEALMHGGSENYIKDIKLRDIVIREIGIETTLLQLDERLKKLEDKQRVLEKLRHLCEETKELLSKMEHDVGLK